MDTDKRSRYDLADYEPFFSGKAAIPNFEPIDPAAFLNVLAAGSGLEATGVRSGRLPGNAGAYAPWARYFLSRTQGGRLDGTGYVAVYDGRYVDGKSVGGRAGRFAICRHEKVDAPGADHSRGWHPGACRLCGLDMTVDSGD